MKNIIIALLKKVPFLQDIRSLIGELLIYLRWGWWYRSKQKPRVLSESFQSQYNELRDNGILKINKSFLDFANYINNNHINHKYSNDSRISCGVMTYDVPLEKKVVEFIIDPLIVDLLYSYYGTTPYLRNDPLIQVVEANDKTSTQLTPDFHVDRYNQLSLMLFLGDVDVDTTHMEFLLQTHKRKFGFWNMYSNFGKTEKVVAEKQAQLHKCIGRKGDAYLFDSMAIHRRNLIPQTKRAMLHLNFTNGHNLYKYKIDSDLNCDLRELSDVEIVLREAKNLVYAGESGHRYFNNYFINKFLGC